MNLYTSIPQRKNKLCSMKHTFQKERYILGHETIYSKIHFGVLMTYSKRINFWCMKQYIKDKKGLVWCINNIKTINTSLLWCLIQYVPERNIGDLIF